MSDTTNITDLPIDPIGGGNNSNNISMTVQETIQNTSSVPETGLNIDQNTISQIVSGLQQASSSGITQLPSRDIPQTTYNLTQDVNVQPNFIPQPQNHVDYISNYEKNEDILNSYHKNENSARSLDDMYNEIQIPLLLSVLYFLFQLPIFRKVLYKYFPFLFLKDGNYNLQGFMFSSVLYGFIFYLINKVIIHFGTF